MILDYLLLQNVLLILLVLLYTGSWLQLAFIYKSKRNWHDGISPLCQLLDIYEIVLVLISIWIIPNFLNKNNIVKLFTYGKWQKRRKQSPFVISG